MSIFAGISWPEQITVQWDDNDVHFVLDQHDVFIVLAHWNNIYWVFYVEMGDAAIVHFVHVE
jgi:hypothetical protein